MSTPQHPTLEQVGARIHQLREAAGLSLTQLSGLSGVGRQTIAYWEAGAHPPILTGLFRVCEALGVHASNVLDNGAGPETLEK